MIADSRVSNPLTSGMLTPPRNLKASKVLA
jgi:hypothetical protein